MIELLAVRPWTNPITLSLNNSMLSVRARRIARCCLSIAAAVGMSGCDPLLFDDASPDPQPQCDDGRTLVPEVEVVPSLFVDATYAGEGVRSIRIDEDGSQEYIDAHLYQVRFRDDTAIEISFSKWDFYRDETVPFVDQLGMTYGRVPAFLRDGLQSIYVRIGVSSTCCGINIQLPDGTWLNLHSISYGILPEELQVGPRSSDWHIIIHELAHFYDEQSPISGTAGWLSAQQADGDFITDYAKRGGPVEDFAESMVWYIVSRYSPNLCPDAASRARNTIPNRIAYLDDRLDTDGKMCPLVVEDC